MSVASKMTAIADKVRSIGGSSGALTLDQMAAHLNTARNYMDESYECVGSKGGTLPDSKVIANLPDAIRSIPEGTELNFEVVGGDTAPENPKANTIWVNTNDDIFDVVFSAGQANAKEGRVWVALGTSSPASFQPIVGGTDGNWIYIYPLEAKQYINGAWVRKTAKTWKNGAWVDWVTYIHKNGDPGCSFLTKAMRPNSSFTSPVDEPIITTSNGVYFIRNVGGASSGSCGVAYVSQKVDLTNVSTIWVDGDFIPPNASYKTYPYIGVWSSFGTYAADNLATRFSPCSETGTELTGKVSVDVSTVPPGEYYIGFCFYATSNYKECGVRLRQLYYE